MPKDQLRRPDKARGRKRDDRLTETILSVAATLLLEVGYDRFRVREVADRAGAGTGAIYRRWPTKQALVAEAIRRMPARSTPASGDRLADLRAVVHRECAGHADNPDLVPGLITAMRADENIEKAVKSGYTLDSFRTVIARVVGPDHPHLDLLAELTPAVALLRASFAPQTLDSDAMTDAIVSLILSLAATTSQS